MDAEQQKRSIRNDILQCIDGSKEALELFDKGEYEKAEDHMESVQATADDVTGELATMEETEEKKEEATETTPPPPPSPQELISAPAESPV